MIPDLLTFSERTSVEKIYKIKENTSYLIEINVLG